MTSGMTLIFMFFTKASLVLHPIIVYLCQYICFTRASSQVTLKVKKKKKKKKKAALVKNISEMQDLDTVHFDAKKKKKKKKKKKNRRKVQGVPQSQTAALPRPQEEEETDKSKQAQTEQTYEKH